MIPRSVFRAQRLAAIAVVLFAVGACDKKSDTPPAPAPTPTATTANAPTAATAATAVATAAATTQPTGSPGSIEGVVHFTGTAPTPKVIDKPTDPVCATASPKDNAIVVGKDKGLKDVLVRIEIGGAHSDSKGTLAQLRQEGCMYVPRVVGVVAGEDVEITNADKTMHNVHTYKGNETVLNAGQPAGSPPLKRAAPDETGMIRVKCDVHPWMTAYMVVTDHPFFTVTDADGKFQIPNVPPGHYKVEAWHPEFGTLTKEIDVTAGKPVDPSFSFTGNEKPN